MASGTTMGTSSVEATPVVSGRLRLTGLTLGAVYWMVGSLKSFGATTTNNATVFQFVAFGMNRGGLWDGVDSLTLWFFGF